MIKKGCIVLVAGGTGGHLFPAIALAEFLLKEGYEVHIITDERASKYITTLKEEAIHTVKSATIKRKTPLSVAKMLYNNLCGLWESRAIFKKIKPSLCIGFGGYPTIPPLIVASFLKIPFIIHEQNVVMGRANKFLACRAKAIAGGFLRNVPKKWEKKLVIVGNPLRSNVLDVAQKFYIPCTKGEQFRLLVFGGSQGASFFSEIIPEMFALFSQKERDLISLVQQSRGPEQVLRARYEALNMHVKLSPFFDNIPQKISNAHFVIARSGASTVSEIAAIGRPSLLVPYPHALDHDQAENAKQLMEAGGALLMHERSLTPEILAYLIREAMDSPEKLKIQAQNAKNIAKLDSLECFERLIKDVQK